MWRRRQGHVLDCVVHERRNDEFSLESGSLRWSVSSDDSTLCDLCRSSTARLTTHQLTRRFGWFFGRGRRRIGHVGGSRRSRFMATIPFPVSPIFPFSLSPQVVDVFSIEKQTYSNSNRLKNRFFTLKCHLIFVAIPSLSITP